MGDEAMKYHYVWIICHHGIHIAENNRMDSTLNGAGALYAITYCHGR